MNEWHYDKIGNLCSAIFSGGTPSTAHEEYWNGGLYWLSSGETCHRYIFSTEKTITQEGADNSSTKLAKAGDVVIASAGQGKTRGQVSVVKADMYINQSVIAMRGHCGKLDNNFLLYNLKMRYEELRTMSDSSSTRGSITTDMLKKLPILIPDLPTQERIADILSAYDDLIENNNRRIALLEKAVRELYKEWFVRFRFPGYETATFENGLSVGWDEVRLNEIIEFNPSLKNPKTHIYKSVPMSALSTSSMIIDCSQIETTDHLAGSRFQNGDTLLARITPCLENGKTGFVQCLDSNEVAGGSTEFIVMRSKKLNPYLVYFIARNETFRDYAIASMNGADGRQRVKPDCLEKLHWLLPKSDIIDAFEENVSESFKCIQILSDKNRNLAKPYRTCQKNSPQR